MSKINQIENAILQLEGGKFQKIDYIEHRIYCEKCIDYIREEIKSTISKEFVYDY